MFAHALGSLVVVPHTVPPSGTVGLVCHCMAFCCVEVVDITEASVVVIHRVVHVPMVRKREERVSVNE